MAGTAASALADQNFRTYDPKYSQRVRGGWRRVQLFANYLFLAGCSGRERAVLGTKGILRLLPGTVPAGFVENLRGLENEYGVVVLPRKPKFPIGTTVVYSPIKLPAVYLGQTTRDRAMILLSLLGSRTRIDVLEAELVAA